MLLLLHSAFMLSVVKMLLKRDVGGHVLNSHGNYLVDHGNHGKIMELCFFNFRGNPVYLTYVYLQEPWFVKEVCTKQE